MQVFGPAAVTSPTQTSDTSSSPTNPTDQLTNENTFLQLLVAQIQNQDPLNPSDPTQFIGELVEFNQLDQLLSINQGVQQLVSNAPSTSSTSGTSPSSNGGN